MYALKLRDKNSQVSLGVVTAFLLVAVVLVLPSSGYTAPATIPIDECELKRSVYNSINGFNLGGTADEMRAVLGEPEPVSIAKSPYAKYPHREYWYEGLKITFSTYGRSALSYAVTSPNFRLRSGVGVGSTRSEIEKKLGQGSRARSGDTDYLIYLVLAPDGRPVPAYLAFTLVDDVVTHFSVTTR